MYLNVEVDGLKQEAINVFKSDIEGVAAGLTSEALPTKVTFEYPDNKIIIQIASPEPGFKRQKQKVPRVPTEVIAALAS